MDIAGRVPREPAAPPRSPPQRPRSGVAERSPAGHTHMAADRRPVMTAVDDEVVTLGFAADRLADRRFEKLVTFGLAQRRTQVRGILLAEAHVEGPGTGDPDPVAALAEIVGQRRDEA